MKIRHAAFLGLVGASLFLFSPAYAEVAAMPAIDSGHILSLDGDVQVREPGGASWTTPQKGAWVKAGSEIKTGPASRCDIGLGEGHSSVLQLKENSQTKLSTLSTSLVHVGLEAGSIFAKVRGLKKDSTFKVSSPTAIASARGTGWEQSMEEINVFENSVEVAGISGEMITVEEGFGVDIDAAGDLKEPEPVSNEDKAEYENFESQAEQLVAEEASSPEGGADGEADKAAGEESAGEAEEAPEGDFDSFGDNFGGEDSENPAEAGGESGSEDVLGEAKEEQQEVDTTDEDLEDDEDCVPSVANGYSCP